MGNPTDFFVMEIIENIVQKGNCDPKITHPIDESKIPCCK